MLIDIHSHLDMCKNIEEIIANAKKVEVRILTCGVNPRSNRETLKIKEKFSEVKICLGAYPTDILKLSKKEINNEIEFIKNNKNKIIGIGEIGLELKKAKLETLEKQKQNLIKFVNLAKELSIPVIVHSRGAEKQAIELLGKENYSKIIMHCFNGNLKLVKRIIENKWFLSIPTNVKYYEHFQKIIELTPIEQLFCETDSPFLHPDKKFPNQPANIIESYKKIAEIKKLGLEEVEKQIEKNYNKVFN